MVYVIQVCRQLPSRSCSKADDDDDDDDNNNNNNNNNNKTKTQFFVYLCVDSTAKWATTKGE
jgi:hypothetical protein